MGEKSKHKVWQYSTRDAVHESGKLIQLWTRTVRKHFRLVLTYSEGIYEWYLLPADFQVGDPPLAEGSAIARTVEHAQKGSTKLAEEFLDAEKAEALFTGQPKPEFLPISSMLRRNSRLPGGS